MPTDKEVDAAARVLARGTCYSWPAFRGESKDALRAAERVRPTIQTDPRFELRRAGMSNDMIKKIEKELENAPKRLRSIMAFSSNSTSNH